MTAGAGLLAAALLAPPAARGGVVSVRVEAAPDERTAVVLVLSGAEVPAVARREGARVLVDVPGEAPEALALPRPRPPVVEMEFEPRPGGAGLVVQLSAPVVCEVRREGREMRLLLDPPPSADDVETLARMLFPPERRSVQAETVAEVGEEERGARVRLRPSLSALYATGTNSYDEGPKPTPDSYWDIGPRVEALGGPARLAYEAHVRGGSQYDAVNSTVTHQVEARLEQQLASDAHLSAGYQFLRGRQQTNAVDPGGEYFYGYQPFRKNTLDGRARIPVGGSTRFVVGGIWDEIRFEDQVGFMDYASWGVEGGLRREIGGQTSLEAVYAHEEVYSASDPNVAGSASDTVDVALTGEVRPMLHVHLLAGLSRRTSPGAPDAAGALDDLVARVNVRREFSDRTALELGYQRSRLISAFEANPSYRSDFLEARSHAPLPFELSLAASLGFRQNSYPLDSAAIGAPRQDRIFGWAIGVGRSLGSRTVAHAEYRWLRRHSNLPGYSSVAHGLLVQVDVRPTGPAR